MIVFQKYISVLATKGFYFYSQKVERKETSYGSIIILKPSPEKSLQMLDNFFLTTDTDTATIHPEVRF